MVETRRVRNSIGLSATKPHQLATDYPPALVTLILLLPLSPNIRSIFFRTETYCNPVLTMCVHNMHLYLPCVWVGVSVLEVSMWICVHGVCNCLYGDKSITSDKALWANHWKSTKKYVHYYYGRKFYGFSSTLPAASWRRWSSFHVKKNRHWGFI